MYVLLLILCETWGFVTFGDLSYIDEWIEKEHKKKDGKEEAREYLMSISWKIGTTGMEYLSEKDADKMREAIDILCDDSDEED